MFFIKQKIKIFVLVILFLGAIFVWSIVFNSQGDILEVHFFDVGQGDAIFIQTPDKKQVLVDGGPDKKILEKLNRIMPFYDRTIDLFILTHPDADHITGLISALEYYNVKNILFSGVEKDTAVYKEWRELIKEKGVPLKLAQAGQKIFLDQDIFLEIIWPDQSLISSYSDPANNASVVTKLVYKEAEFLLTGDIEKKVENLLINNDLNLESDILKVPHHGSKTSSSFNFVKAVNPFLSIISVGRDNKHNHPNKEVLSALNSSVIYRTDKNGDIEVLTNGELFDILLSYE